MIHRKTKIIATLGPATENYDMMLMLAKFGLDVVRINFSHGTHAEHLEKINNINKIYEEENIILTSMCDLRGPEIRVDKFENGEIDVKPGDVIKICSNTVLGNKERFSTNYPNLYKDLSIGDKIAFDDGKLIFQVIEKEGKNLICKAENNHVLKDNKGVNAPGVHLNTHYISERDREDIAFIVQHKIDYVAASFVRSKEDVIELRELLNSYGRQDIKIISKIENREGIDNIDEIIKHSNAIMVARGDLGIEISVEEVPMIQKDIIRKCNIAGKPVVVATHMLESMQHSPTPTRAEVSDIANAILDGVDAVMLSGETAVGQYPLQSFLMQSKIAIKIENDLDFEKKAYQFFDYSNKSQGDSVGISLATMCLLMDIKFVAVISKYSTPARKLAKFKMKSPIIGIVPDRLRASFLNGLYYGIKPLIDDIPETFEEKVQYVVDLAEEYGVEKGSQVILVTDNPINKKADLIKIIQL